MKKESISLQKALIAKQEKSEDWVEEEEIFKYEGINAKGFIALIKDTTNGALGKCGADTSQFFQE